MMNFRRAPVCHECGSINCRKIEVVSHGNGPEIKIEEHLCEACFTKAIEQYQELQRQFQELLDLGVNRALANEVMLDRIERAKQAKPARTP
jgi:hypothetical protein